MFVAQSMVGDVAIPGERIADFQEKCRAIASVQNESLTSPVSDDSATRCLPSASKFSGASHCVNAASIADQSPSVMPYHAVSRLRLLYTTA